MSKISFLDNLAWGQVGESLIAEWLKNKGYSVLPVYEKEIDNGKGPRLFMPTGQLIAPDIFAFTFDRALWVEAKHKNRFTWYGKEKCWNTGIDKRHYDDYCRVAKETPYDVWLFFLHQRSDAWREDVEKRDAPPVCPTGLFAGNLNNLPQPRFSPDYAKGMVYWKETDLKKLAELSDVLETGRRTND